MNRSGLYLFPGLTTARIWQPFGFILAALVVGLILAWLPPVTGALIVGVIGLLLLIAIRPLFGLAITLVAGPFGAYEDIILPGNLPDVGQIIFIFTIAAWLGHGVTQKRIRIPKSALYRPLVLFIILGTVSLLGAPSLDHGLKEVAKWVGLGMAMIITLDLSSQPISANRNINSKGTRSLGSLRWVLLMLLVAGAVQAIIGIWQFGIWQDGPAHFLILDRFYRAFGTFMQPNPFGGYMGITAALAVGAIIGLMVHMVRQAQQGHKPQTADILWTIFIAFCALLMVTALLMSWSRGAWLGFASGMAVLAVFIAKAWWKGALLLTAGALLMLVSLRIGLLPNSIAQRLENINQQAFVTDVRGVQVNTANFADVERLAHWQAGIEMARHNLVSGVGFGNYEPAYTEYGLLNWPIALGHAHNYYINILAETGVFGAVAYSLFWAFVFFRLITLLRKTDWPHRGIALGLLAGWTALCVHQLVDNLYVNNMYLAFGVMLGLQGLMAKRYD